MNRYNKIMGSDCLKTAESSNQVSENKEKQENYKRILLDAYAK